MFKVKLKPDGSIAKHKAKLVAKGFLQKQGIDYTEVYAPVARMETIRLVIVISSSKNWTICQLDVKFAFLNGPLEEEVYILQPPGFEIKGKEHKVYKLLKALYGLKKASRAWNRLIDNFLGKQGFVKCTVEFGVYVKETQHKNLLFVCLYVDDLIIIGDVNEEIEQFKEKMKSEFDITDLGILHYFLGFEFMHTQKGIFLHQRKYTGEVLKRFNMENCNIVTVPVMPNLKLTEELDEKPVDATLFKQIIGSLRFLCNSRLDISYGVGLLSRFMGNPRAPHMTAAKHILRYLKGTSDFGLLFPIGNDQNRSYIEAYSDSDWCSDKVERKSTSGYLLKYLDAPIS